MYDIPDFTTEPSPKWVRAYVGDVPIVDSRNVVLFFEPHYPKYFFPQTDVRMDLLEPSARTEPHDPRGAKVFWHLRAGDRRETDAAFTYRRPPKAGQADMSDFISFRWDALDAWFEEEDQVYVHPRNPYSRVDVAQSSRHIRVTLDGTELADTSRPVLLWETRLPTRYYIPPADVRTALLRKSATVTQCPYKGTAETYSVVIGDRTYDDHAWCYPAPIPECAKIEGLICFYSEKVDIVEDGVRLPRPKSRWS
ncbi:MAG: DUF427 domain-containing protein [Alphaproteobacteria bacterium]|nr:DUF427 domain-containing protein [Alphaproteobacteria bacterium]